MAGEQPQPTSRLIQASLWHGGQISVSSLRASTGGDSQPFRVLVIYYAGGDRDEDFSVHTFATEEEALRFHDHLLERIQIEAGLSRDPGETG